MEVTGRYSETRDQDSECETEAQSSSSQPIPKAARANGDHISMSRDKVNSEREADKRHSRPWHQNANSSNLPACVPLSPAALQIGEALFEQFCEVDDLPEILGTFNQLCDVLGVIPSDIHTCFPVLRNRLRSWKARSLLSKLEKKATANVYRRGQVASGAQVLVIGAGPCGLRTAIECALLGARTCVIEKRARFTRNNVVHIWPFIIADLKALGAKSFYGRFAAGSIEHISIRRLQAILLKVALLLGVDVQPNVAFVDLEQQSEDGVGSDFQGWRATCEPQSHPVNSMKIDVLVGADGRRNTLRGFERKEFRGRLAIAITCNFINRHSREEASVPEISGVSRIFKPHFFQQLVDATGIDLENIVYYKDDTHYFVMTATKASLLAKGVLKQDYAEATELLAAENVEREALLSYAREACEFSTGHALPSLEWARNQTGEEDLAMFDFTCLHKAVHSSMVRVRFGRALLMTLVGDSLCEPFWPIGSGIGRGFLSSLDAAWMVRDWFAGHKSRMQVLAERELLCQLLSQTSDDNLNKQHAHYTIQPRTRYPLLDLSAAKAEAVAHLVLRAESDAGADAESWLYPAHAGRASSCHRSTDAVSSPLRRVADANVSTDAEADLNAGHSHIDTQQLLRWFQIRLQRYAHRFTLIDLCESWYSGVALCSLVHLMRPDLLNLDSLDETNRRENLEQAFALSQQAFGFKPSCSVDEALAGSKPFAIALSDFLERYFWLFKDERVKTLEMPFLAKRKSNGKPGILHGMAQKLGRSKVYSNDATVRRPPASSSENVPFAPNCSIYDSPPTNNNAGTTAAAALAAPTSASGCSTDASLSSGKQKRVSASERDDSSAKNKVAGLAQLLFGSGSGTGGGRDKDKEKKHKEKRETNGAPFAAKTRDLLMQLPLFRSSSSRSSAAVAAAASTNGETAAPLVASAVQTPVVDKLSDNQSTLRAARPVSEVLPSPQPLAEPDRPKQLRRALLAGVSSAARQGRCIVCAERVYPAERLAADGYAFHRGCFRCFECDCPLRLSAYILLRDETLAPSFFCVPHGNSQARQRKTSASTPTTVQASSTNVVSTPSIDMNDTPVGIETSQSSTSVMQKLSNGDEVCAEVRRRRKQSNGDGMRSSRTLTMRHERPTELKRSSLIVPVRSFLNESDDERPRATAEQDERDEYDEDLVADGLGRADGDGDGSLSQSALDGDGCNGDGDGDGDQVDDYEIDRCDWPENNLDDSVRRNLVYQRETDADAESSCSSNTTSTSLYDPSDDRDADDGDDDDDDGEDANFNNVTVAADRDIRSDSNSSDGQLYVSKSVSVTATPVQAQTQSQVRTSAPRVERTSSASAKFAFLQCTAPLRIDAKSFFANENLRKLTEGDASVMAHSCVAIDCSVALATVSIVNPDLDLLLLGPHADVRTFGHTVTQELSSVDSCSQPQLGFFAALPVEQAELISNDDDYIEVLVADAEDSAVCQPQSLDANFEHGGSSQLQQQPLPLANSMLASVYSAVSIGGCDSDDHDADTESSSEDEPQSQSKSASLVDVHTRLRPSASMATCDSSASPSPIHKPIDVRTSQTETNATPNQLLLTTPSTFNVDLKFIEDTCTELEDHSDVEQRARGGRTSAKQGQPNSIRKAAPPASLNVATPFSSKQTASTTENSTQRNTSTILLAPKATFSSDDSDESLTDEQSDSQRPQSHAGALSNRRPFRRMHRRNQEPSATVANTAIKNTVVDSPLCGSSQHSTAASTAASTPTHASGVTTPSTVVSGAGSTSASGSRGNAPPVTSSSGPTAPPKRRPDLLVDLFLPVNIAALKAKRASAAYASDSEAPCNAEPTFMHHSPVSTTVNTPSSPSSESESESEYNSSRLSPSVCGSSVATPVGEEQKPFVPLSASTVTSPSTSVAPSCIDRSHSPTPCETEADSTEQLVDHLRSLTQRTRTRIESQRPAVIGLPNSHEIPPEQTDANMKAMRLRNSNSIGSLSISGDSQKLVKMIETRLGVDIEFADAESDVETPSSSKCVPLASEVDSSASDTDALYDEDEDDRQSNSDRRLRSRRRRADRRRKQMQELQCIVEQVDSRVVALDTAVAELEESLKKANGSSLAELRTRSVLTAVERLNLLRFEARLFGKVRDVQLEEERQRLETTRRTTYKRYEEDRELQRRVLEASNERSRLAAQRDRDRLNERDEDETLQRVLRTREVEVDLEKIKADTLSRFKLSFPLG